MITNFKERTRKDDIKLLASIIAVFLFVVWICTPPGNKFLQIAFWGNNTQMLVAKIKNEDSTEYKFHRNNAVYIAKMYPKGNKLAVKEMNKAISLLPSYAPEAELKRLYAERAQINMYLGNYKQALSDYINAGDIGFNDYIKVALLYKMAGNYREAISYCNAILNVDPSAFAGYACLADVYSTVGKQETALKVWTILIERKGNSAKAYLGRAKLRQKLGDTVGYKEDMEKVKELAPALNPNDSYIDDILNPKIITISVS